MFVPAGGGQQFLFCGHVCSCSSLQLMFRTAAGGVGCVCATGDWDTAGSGYLAPWDMLGDISRCKGMSVAAWETDWGNCR